MRVHMQKPGGKNWQPACGQGYSDWHIITVPTAEGVDCQRCLAQIERINREARAPQPKGKEGP